MPAGQSLASDAHLAADIFDLTENVYPPTTVLCSVLCVVLIVTHFFIVFVVYLSALEAEHNIMRIGCLSDSLLCSPQNVK